MAPFSISSRFVRSTCHIPAFFLLYMLSSLFLERTSPPPPLQAPYPTAPLPAEGAGSPRSPCGTTARRCCRGPCTLARPSSSPVPHAGHRR